MSNTRLLPQRFGQRTLAQLGQANIDKPLYHFLETNSMEWVSAFDDFVGDTINLDNYAVVFKGASGTAFQTVVARNGAIQATTGTATSCSASLVTPIIYNGTSDSILSARLYLDNVTGVNFEMGFVDAVPGSDAPALTSATSGTFAGTNAALLSCNRADGISTMVFATIGNAASQTAVVTTLNATSPTLPSPFTVPTATVMFEATIQLIQNNAYLFLNNILVARHEGAAGVGAVNKATDMAAWLYVQSKVAGGAARSMRVDWFWPRCRRL